MLRATVLATALAALSATAFAADYNSVTNSDDALKAAVIDALKSDAKLSGTINVRTDHGAVIVEGRVPASGDIDRVDRDLQNFPGLRELDNRLIVDLS